MKIEDSSGDGFVSQIHFQSSLYIQICDRNIDKLVCYLFSYQKCCKYGNGSYRYGIDGENIYNSRGVQTFTSVGIHTFWVETRPTTQSLSDSVSWFIPRDDSLGFEANMSARDHEWLTAHNIRRKRYHEEFNKTYIPLKWSPALAEEAKVYAIELLSDCDYDGIVHEQNVGEGENLAKNEGRGNWGDLYPADSILTRWVEREVGVGSPGNAHMTQVCPPTEICSSSRFLDVCFVDIYLATTLFFNLGSLESVEVRWLRGVRKEAQSRVLQNSGLSVRETGEL